MMITAKRLGARRCAHWLMVLMLLAGCATAQTKRSSRLRSELDQFQIHQPLSTVWPVALRVVAEQGYQLVGHDREVAGQPSAGILKAVTDVGFESTRGNGGMAAETMEEKTTGPSRGNVHYRIDGFETGARTCRVTFTAIQRVGETLDEYKRRDLEMELELIRRIEPAEAARILDIAEKG